MDFNNVFKGKTALVTGASSGIGRAIAIGLGKYRSNVICVARNRANVRETAKVIQKNNSNAYAEVLDVTDPDATKSFAEKISRKHKSLDFVFLNAGGQSEISDILNSDLDRWRYDIELNMLSVYYGIKFFAPLMKENGGKIIFTGSGLAQNTRNEYSSYCCSKAGARMLAKVAAQELAVHDITVNELVPGPVVTPLTEKGFDSKSKGPAFGHPNEWVKQPDDVVDLALSIAALPGKGPTGQTFSLMRR